MWNILGVILCINCSIEIIFSNICCCVVDIVQTVSGSDFALNCREMSVKQLCIECCLTCSKTLGLLGNVSCSSPTPFITAAGGGSRLFGPERKASGVAGFSIKSTQSRRTWVPAINKRFVWNKSAENFIIQCHGTTKDPEGEPVLILSAGKTPKPGLI